MANIIVENEAGGRRAARMCAQWLHNDGPSRQWRYFVARMRMNPEDAHDLDEMLDDLDETREMRSRPKRRGLAKRDLGKNKNGKVVSKKQSAKGKKSAWIAACTAARKALNIKDFAAIKKGSAQEGKGAPHAMKALGIKDFAVI